MNKYNDLELSILSCIIQRPNLMNKIILEDKHFVKHKKLWLFLKAFYKKFGNFDLTLMLSVSKDKNRIIEYVMWLYDKEPAPSLFEIYQKQLIELYEETKKEKWIIDKIYELVNELVVRNIELKDFRKNIDDIYIKADEIFKGVD